MCCVFILLKPPLIPTRVKMLETLAIHSSRINPTKPSFYQSAKLLFPNSFTIPNIGRFDHPRITQRTSLNPSAIEFTHVPFVSNAHSPPVAFFHQHILSQYAVTNPANPRTISTRRGHSTKRLKPISPKSLSKAGSSNTLYPTQLTGVSNESHIIS